MAMVVTACWVSSVIRLLNSIQQVKKSYQELLTALLSMWSKRINYPVRSLRVDDKLWQDLRFYKFHRKLTWNKMLQSFLDSASQEKSEKPAKPTN